ncbi:pyruvate dehydrogenase complex transcriptional repressor PdhR [Psychrobium sp. 1_MG-2023]|uniref:pyruvate dehydrogenase complex transcriptional repressor PdhR n=1 Tax=Psychrobium sp. 1_MG-2023 TaxID=3062624 RepID=UPI002732FF7E|nr:pyruvate dehydrogenase complex transcriptional repressor PdhR [Psychrobium sp. 1_MG-2023]MDP2562042.1 pyruvate dehydrogenase complex transcriptional repressor PdhR [Psychrobium sp. 1_MG-2023]
MTYRKIRQPKLSDAIVEALETMILEGTLRPGEKLPSERDLAKQFEVSRPSIREAIQALEAKGLLSRRQGGGTYVQDQLWQSLSDPVLELIANDPESQYDLLEFRHATEGMLAFYAAIRGTTTDFERIRACQEAIAQAQQSQDIDLEANAIVELYKVVAEASHNVAMLHLVLSMSELLRQNIVQNLALLYRHEKAVEVSNKHRSALIEAIVSRDSEQARNASNAHLAYIEEVLLSVRQEDSRVQRALRRIQNNDPA